MFFNIRRLSHPLMSRLLSLLIISAGIMIISLPTVTQARQLQRDQVRPQEQSAQDSPAMPEDPATLTPQPVAMAAATDFQPSPPYYATFYYPWYGSPLVDPGWAYWNGESNNSPGTWFSHFLPDPVPSQFDPSRELYSSRDANTLFWQFGKMAEAKQEVAISSWWGQGDRADNNFRFVISDVMKRSENPYPNLRWSLYYEPESTSDPSVEQLVAHLNYIADNYTAEPAFLKVGGKPVVFVYTDGNDGAAMAQRWSDAKAQAKIPFHVVLKLFSGYKTVAAQPDSWHQYGPASRFSDHAPYSFSVSPGFWFDHGGEAPRLERNLSEFTTVVQQMVASNATWKLVTTWNEWGEGTSVEPGEQVRLNSSTSLDEPDPSGAPFKNAYVDVLSQHLPALEAGTGTEATPATPVPPTATPVPPTATPVAPTATSAPIGDSGSSFSFGVAGDIGGGSKATASFGALASAATNFFLAIGDLSYDEVTPESAWCQYVQQQLGASYPFELLIGNHEETTAGPDGFIDNFAACLPDRLNATGIYAHRYYFDYPPEAPLARFILIDPAMIRDGVKTKYCSSGDTENCNWLKARIDEAKSQGLWTIVAMHKNCITIGTKSCEIDPPLVNTLLERKVDLILQGHDHGYQRSKQLSLGAACTGVQSGAFNAGCVVDDGADGMYSRGAGPIQVIAGNFGRSSSTYNTSDPEIGYIAAWNDSTQPTNGFVKVTVSQDSISARFVNSQGSYTDSFSIGAATSQPTPPPTATPISATGQYTFTPSADSYVRSDKPTSNYGNIATIEVDASPLRYSYLRFNVENLAGTIVNAKLYIYATTSSSKGYEVRGVSSNSWSENTLTYNNRPAFGAVVARSGALSAGQWTEVPVTALVNGNGTISLAMSGISSTSVTFSSRQGSQPPMLVITTGVGGQGDEAIQDPPVLEETDDTPEVDSDGDGMSDADELANGTDLNQHDSDGDGLPDLWEVEGGLNPNSPSDADGAEGDPDGDGLSNLDEYNGQSEPLIDESTLPEITSVELYLPAVSGE